MNIFKQINKKGLFTENRHWKYNSYNEAFKVFKDQTKSHKTV